MKNLILCAILIFGGLTVNAQEMAVTGGMQTTDVDTDMSGVDLSSGTGFYGGVLGFIEAGDGNYFRSGALISMRSFESNLAGGITYKAELTGIDIPLTYLMMFSENAGVYGGLKLGLNVSEGCSVSGSSLPCIDPDATGMYYSASVGGHFRFVPNFGVEVEFNLGLSEIADDVDYKSSLAAGLVYLF